MRNFSKILISIFLVIIIFIMTSCNLAKGNNVSNNIDENLIIDRAVIKDISYFVYKSEDNKKQKLYKQDASGDLKVLLEKNSIELYESDNFLYVYYYDADKTHRHNIFYIDDFKNDTLKECHSYNNGKITFSGNNKYLAVSNDFELIIYEGNKVIYHNDISLDSNDKTKVSPLFESLFIKASDTNYSKANKHIDSFEFSDDNKVFLTNYSIDNLSNIFLKIDLLKAQSYIYLFHDHGTYNDKNYKFNLNTGDVLYVADSMYPYKSGVSDTNENILPWINHDENEQKNAEAEKFLYLRNIYTQEMFVVDKLQASNQDNYTYNFTKDDEIEINGEIVKRDVKTRENLVYAEFKSGNINPVETDSSMSNHIFNIDEKIASNIGKYIKEIYDIDSQVLKTLNYNNVTFAIVSIPNYYIDYLGKYVKINSSNTSSSFYNYSNSSLELWRYENGDCKRILYYQTYFSIYNIGDDKGYLMIQGEVTNPGYIVKLDKNDNILYEAKYKGFLKSPDNKYTLIHNIDESFTVVENDKIIIDYSIRGNDDINSLWYYTVSELGPCWWDLEHNKLYIVDAPSIHPTCTVYSVDLTNMKVIVHDNIKNSHDFSLINKELSYICSNNSSSSRTNIGHMEDLIANRKYSNYIYNLLTNEKFYLTDYTMYNNTRIDNNFVTYRGYDTELTLDISPYVDKDRINYVKKIKASIIESYKKGIKDDNIELSLIFNTGKEKYQIVKINKDDNSSYYELWKINDNKFEKIIDKSDNIFLTNNQEYLCIVSNNGELRVYDKNFDCIINENTYSEELLKRCNLESLSMPLYYIIKHDTNIFLPIKGGDNLVDVVNVDLINREISYLGRDLNCNYDNFAINPKTGYLIYQEGPSIIEYDEENNVRKLNFYDLNEKLMLIDLMENGEGLIKRDELDPYLY